MTRIRDYLGNALGSLGIAALAQAILLVPYNNLYAAVAKNVNCNNGCAKKTLTKNGVKTGCSCSGKVPQCTPKTPNKKCPSLCTLTANFKGGALTSCGCGCP